MEVNIKIKVEAGKIASFFLSEDGKKVMEYNCPLTVNEAVRKVKYELDKVAGKAVRYSKYILRDDEGHITAYKASSERNAIRRAVSTFEETGEWRQQ